MESWAYFAFGVFFVLIMVLLGLAIYFAYSAFVQANTNQESLNSICTYINTKEALENEVHEPCIGFQVADETCYDEDDDDDEEDKGAKKPKSTSAKYSSRRIGFKA